jgi:hypothetical protein
MQNSPKTSDDRHLRMVAWRVIFCLYMAAAVVVAYPFVG